MTEGSAPLPAPRPGNHALVPLVGTAVLAMISVAGLTWAKWLPYAGKLAVLNGSHRYDGSSLLHVSGPPGASPTWSGTWEFTVTYGVAIWKALLVGLLVAAAIDALVPRRWLLRALGRGGRLGQSVTGGLLAVPCMMCTCCTAPVTVAMRRSGVPTSSAVAYWLGNPVLNPAVLAFLFLATPWQWGVVRLVVGLLLVVGASAVLGRIPDRRGGAPAEAPVETMRGPDPTLAQLPRYFLRSLLRLAVVLVPEYFVVVVLLGAFSGWASSFAPLRSHLGLLAVLVAAVIGTLLVIPTAGEIPILLGLAALGLGSGVLGALLVSLPAVSLPSMVMVGRSLSARVTAATAGAVVVAGVAAGLLLWGLTAG